MELLALLLVLSCSLSVTFGQDCRTIYTCSQCIIQNSSCAWCDDQDVFSSYVSDVNTQLKSAELCGTMDELSRIGCKNIVNPVGSVTLDDENTLPYLDEASGGSPSPPSSNNVAPQTATVNLRPGVKESFSVNIAPPRSVSVDMYILMDLSFTMLEDLGTVRNFGNALVDLMQGLTDEFRIGFGSFVDKPVDPFAGRRNIDTPCAREGPSVSSQCVPTYDYRHHINFTADANQFTQELGSASVSGSVDNPEALFDALLQVSVCENLIGWSPIGTSRRIILVMTDGDYHIALDGRLAGILSRPTTECQVNPITNVYETATEYDFPSASFIAEVLNENRITPIFAVRREVLSLYNDLRETIRSAVIGEIVASATNLLTLIEEQYRILSTTVVPLINGADEIDELTIEVLPLHCGAGGILSSDRSDVCQNVTFPNSVQYEISLEVSPTFCDRTDAQSSHKVQVLFIGFGDISIDITAQCSCLCEADRVENSPVCNGNGAFECSTCICEDNFIGNDCGCPTGITAVFGCSMGGKDSTVCSNRGRCVCNECKCNSVPTLGSHTYQGRYCECDPFSCPFGANENGEVLPCSGHGICGCDSQCSCDGGYSGLGCGCSNRTSTCTREGEDELCSGSGQCRCGVCVCYNYTERRGQYCEECVTCTGSCSLLNDCVECLITDSCGSNCAHVSLTHSPADIPTYNKTNFAFRNCSAVNSNCEVIYQMDEYVVGVEQMIQVYINDSQRSFRTWRNNPSGCKPSPDFLIYVIPASIVVLIIIIVLLALAGWKAITVLAEYTEYKKWENSQRKEQWDKSEDNPLFVDPTASYTNPKYRRPVQRVDSSY